jgi:hypothetical protein
LGGSAQTAAAAVDGTEALLEHLRSGGNYHADSPGAPIAYVLAYLDHSPARAGITAEYTARTCVRNRANVDVSLKAIRAVAGRALGDLEVYGRVSVRYPTENNGVDSCDSGGDVAAVWERGGRSWVEVPAQGEWRPESPPVVSLIDVAIAPDSHLCLAATLDEHDIGVDDHLGSDAQLLRFDAGWLGEHVLRLEGEGRSTTEVVIDVALR